jgi:basic membrane protein A
VSTEAAVEKPLRVAMVLPGPITDGGFNTGGKAGLDALAERFKAETAFSDAVPPTDYVEVFRDFASQGFNIVIGHGNEFNDAAMTVKDEYPNAYFIVLGGQDTPGGNVISAVYHEAQAGFIPGYIAGKMTKTNRVAAIGGFDFPGIIAQLEGFRQGVEYANPNAKVEITYIGTFEDVAKAKEAALAQIDAGADVVFHIVDNAGVGVFEAVKERNVYGVGFAADQSSAAPDNVITSETIDFGNLYGAAVEVALSGEPVKTEQYRFGYEAQPPPIGHADTKLVPDELHQESVGLQQKLASGEIETELIFTR